MRWKKKPSPNIRDRRIVEKFLWFPICLDQEWRWLEKAKIEQKYGPSQLDVLMGIGINYCWANMAWADE